MHYRSRVEGHSFHKPLSIGTYFLRSLLGSYRMRPCIGTVEVDQATGLLEGSENERKKQTIPS